MSDVVLAIVLVVRFCLLPVAIIVSAIHQLAHGWLFTGHRSDFRGEPWEIRCMCGKVIWRVRP